MSDSQIIKKKKDKNSSREGMLYFADITTKRINKIIL
jgi:hypothetical protein